MEKGNKIMINEFVEEYFNYDKKWLDCNLESLKPSEIMHLIVDWMDDFNFLEIIGFFKVKISINEYKYFILSSDLDFYEYLEEEHTFTTQVNKDIENKLINLFVDDSKEEAKKEIYSYLTSMLRHY